MKSSSDNPRRRPGYHVPRAEGVFDSAVAHQDLSPESYEELNSLTSVIYEVQPTAFAYAILERNHNAIEATLAAEQQRYRSLFQEGRNPVEDGYSSLIVLTQWTNNFLSSASGFLDQTNRRLTSSHGKGSRELQDWTALRSSLHDSRFSYRFLYQLRHYAQHFALPLNNLQVNANRDAPDKALEYQLGLEIRRDDLLKDGFDWKHAHAGIEAQDPSFDLLPLAREYLDSLALLCRAYLHFHSNRIADCGNYLRAYLKSFGIPSNAWPVLFIGESDVPGCAPGQVEWIPVQQFQFIQQLLNRLPEKTNDPT